jgi:hypothetical protein
MKTKPLYSLLSIALAMVILMTSCVCSTLIQSNPPGAKVTIDGMPAGVTPLDYSDMKIVASTTEIKLEKPGFETKYVRLEKNEQVDVGALIGGLICYVPFLWIMRYSPYHNYELEPLAKTDFQNAPSQQEQNSTPLQNSNLKIEKMRELKKMLDENLISKEDFEKQKERILNEN